MSRAPAYILCFVFLGALGTYLLAPLIGPTAFVASVAFDASSAYEVPSWAKVAPEQIAEAKKHGVPVAFENDLGMRFVLIPAGTFLMGALKEERLSGRSQEWVGQVRLTKPFYMQTTEVTNGQYRRLNSEHRSVPRNAKTQDGDKLPVGNVSWSEAAEFAAWISAQAPPRQFALPTEAQWEYACRAGTTTAFNVGAMISPAEANFSPNRLRIPPLLSPASAVGHVATGTTPVGTYGPSAWGIYDMHGNAAEWCRDFFDPEPPQAQAQIVDPLGPRDGVLASTYPDEFDRVVRGGSWRVTARGLHSAARQGVTQNATGYWLGFRLVSPLPEPK